MIRQYHRWISWPLMIFLVITISTGIGLQVEELEHLTEASGAKSSSSTLPSDPIILAQLERALIASRQADPDLAVQRIELNYAKGEAVGKFLVTPRGGASVEVNLDTGVAEAKGPPKPNFHGIMVRLHTGQYFGPLGIGLIMAAGLVLLFLAISGGFLYLQMWRNRKGRGNSELFWR